MQIPVFKDADCGLGERYLLLKIPARKLMPPWMVVHSQDDMICLKNWLQMNLMIPVWDMLSLKWQCSLSTQLTSRQLRTKLRSEAWAKLHSVYTEIWIREWRRFPGLNTGKEPGATESSATHLRLGSSGRRAGDRAWGALVEVSDLQNPQCLWRQSRETFK